MFKYIHLILQELLVPMNDDVNIYDGTDINASLEKKSKNTWIEMFDMIDLTFNNLQWMSSTTPFCSR